MMGNDGQDQAIFALIHAAKYREAFRLGEPDTAALATIFREMEFKRFQEKYPLESDLSAKNYTAVTDRKALEELSKALAENLWKL